MKIHPCANLFPMMSLGELQELAKSIKENGLRNNIVTLDGAIIDGRNREKACRLAGVTPRYTELCACESPTLYVLDQNARRRHLRAGQLSSIAGSAVPMLEAEAAERKREACAEAGKSAGRGRPKGEARSEPHPKRRQDEYARSTAQAAKAVGVSRGSVEATALDVGHVPPTRVGSKKRA